MRTRKILAVAAAILVALLLGGCRSKTAYDTAEKSASGFVDVAMPSNAKDNTVIIFAPLNCPREAGQRAQALHERLKQLEVPNMMSNSYSLRFTDNSEEFKAKLQRTNAVMQGELPIVLINGMGKPNPTAEEVVAEYERTSQGK